MESDPHALVPQALQVIQNVSTMASCVTVNEPECKRIADRFSAIGEGLTGVGQDQNFCDGKAIDATGSRKDYPDLHWLLAVLRKGEALLSLCRVGGEALVARCRDIWNGKQPEEFQKIHEELDTFKIQFDFEGFRDGLAKDCDAVSGTMTTTEMKGDFAERKGDFVVEDYLKIDPLDIQLGEMIGKGGNAEVYEATWSRCRCAVKRFESACMNQDFIPKLQMELDFLIRLRHPFLVQLMGLSVDTEHRCSIVMELMSGSLRGLIDSRLESGKTVPFEFREAVMIIRKIALGMRFVHSRGVLHRDLKAANVMVAERPGSIDVKVADFGESQFMDASKVYGTAGTTAWMAPEILPPVATSSKPSSVGPKAADVYSFAMTCFEVLSGEKPFSGRLNNEQKQEVRSGLLRPVLPVELDRRLIGLIKACWDSKPEKRPNFELICCILDQILRFRKPSEVSELLPFCEDVVQEASAGNGEIHIEPICRDESASEIEYFKSDYESECEHLIICKHRSIEACISAFRDRGSSGGRGRAFSFSEYLKINKIDFGTNTNSMALPRLPYHYWVRLPSGKINSQIGMTVEWLGCTFKAISYAHDWLLNASVRKMVQGEIDMMVALRHPHIVQLFGICDSVYSPFSIVMETMTSTLTWKLRRYRKKKASRPRPAFDLHEAVVITRKIASGMAFLHSRGIVHRHLSPDSVFVNESPGSFDVKIGNFRFSESLHGRNPREEAWLNHTSNSGLDNKYSAPEIFTYSWVRNLTYGDLKPADVYSFAMTCYSIFSGQSPFERIHPKFSEFKVAVIGGDRPTLPADLHPDVKVLIEKCWHKDPLQRPDFNSICDELQRIQLALPRSSSSSMMPHL